MSVKPWLSLDEQVALLQGRGLIVSDAAACRTFLQRIGYYHLSGYGRYFQVDPARGDNSFRSGTRFEDISELQVLDSQLRLYAWAHWLMLNCHCEPALRIGLLSCFERRAH